MIVSQICQRDISKHWLKWQTPLEKVRWVVLCTGSNIIAVSIHPSLTAVVLSKTNKSKYFSPSCVCDIFICINVNKCKTNKTQHMKVWSLCPYGFILDKLIYMHALHGTDIIQTERHGRGEGYIKVKKNAFETWFLNELCSKSMTAILSGNDSSTKGFCDVTVYFLETKRHFSSFTQHILTFQPHFQH